jgi:hypothetical protein
LHELDSTECQHLGEFLLMTFSKFIKEFFGSTSISDEDANLELLYTICMVLKRLNFSNTINLNYLGLEKGELSKKVESIKSIS